MTEPIRAIASPTALAAPPAPNQATGQARGDSADSSPTSGSASPCDAPPAGAARRAAYVWWVFGLCAAATLASALTVAGGGAAVRGHMLPIVLGGVVLAAAACDMLTRRIPNAITYPAMVLGLGLNSLGLLLPASSQGAALVQSWLGTVGPLSAMAGLGVCAVIGVLGFAVRGLGGGDAKLLGAIGALAGAPAVFPILCNILIVASAIALVNYLSRGALLGRLDRVAASIYAWLMGVPWVGGIELSATQIPFALAALGGVALTPFWSAISLFQLV